VPPEVAADQLRVGGEVAAIVHLAGQHAVRLQGVRGGVGPTRRALLMQPLIDLCRVSDPTSAGGELRVVGEVGDIPRR